MDTMSRTVGAVAIVALGLVTATTLAVAQPQAPQNILIHMKTSLAEDDAQICAVPNVAWGAVRAGHKVRILVDASAVTSVTKGWGWFNALFRSDSTALDRAELPERERASLAEQMEVPLGQVPRDYGEYLKFLKMLGVEIYGNRTMMLLYEIDPTRLAEPVIPVSLDEMVRLFETADRIIVY